MALQDEPRLPSFILLSNWLMAEPAVLALSIVAFPIAAILTKARLIVIKAAG